MGATTSTDNHQPAEATSGKQPATTAATITSGQIRTLCRDGFVDASTAWDAIYNDHTPVGRQARERCATTLNALELADDLSVVSVEVCS